MTYLQLAVRRVGGEPIDEMKLYYRNTSGSWS